MKNCKNKPWHSKSIEETLSDLDSSEEGLSDAKADELLKKYGFNQLNKSKIVKRIVIQRNMNTISKVLYIVFIFIHVTILFYVIIYSFLKHLQRGFQQIKIVAHL